MPSMNEERLNQKHWRSLDDLADTPEFRAFVENEFPSMADDYEAGGLRRRGFLKLMGASMALAGFAGGCRWPEAKILPFARRPEGRIPGRPLQYATLVEQRGHAVGALATSYDGRPIKLDGNPIHPASLGGSNASLQAAILELYDPDRAKYVSTPGKDGNKTWDDFLADAAAIRAAAARNGGEGFRVLSEPSSSPSLSRMRRELLAAYPKAQWHEYAPLSADNARKGSALAYGKPFRILHRFDRARVIVSFDGDFLMEEPFSLRYAREFADGRTADDGKMNRLYMAESRHSITGSMADHRIALRSGRIHPLAFALAAELFGRRGLPLPAGSAGPGEVQADPAWEGWISKAADDLMASKGAGLVLAGPRQPAEVHALTHALNEALGNAGETALLIPDLEDDRPGHLESLSALTADLIAGKVKTLLVLGGNPAYDAPVDLDFAKAIGAAAMSVHLHLYKNETGRLCSWSLPQAHPLESWGDGAAWDGTHTAQQPLIEPLYGGKTAAELLSVFLKEHGDGGREIARQTFDALFPGATEKEWEKNLHDGLRERTARDVERPALMPGAVTGPAVRENSEGFEIVFVEDYKVLDGRGANNGWLLELPDPISKLTWDNAALISPADAKKLGAAREDVIRIELNGRSLEAPVFVLPGQAAGSVTLTLGYGRAAAGRMGDGVGYNAYALRDSRNPHFASGASITKTGAVFHLASTQDHQSIKELGHAEAAKREPTLVREGELAQYQADPAFVKHAGGHAPELLSLWKEFEYNGHAWGMSVDLSRCIGCSACMTACQAENNIPVVGKREVRRGREMHWIRVDRYFTGSPEDPKTAFQPVACQQCENAPCEPVCPVGATQHSHEGLNDMAYNRCVGTRYCANNCPYKVRRFNYFLNHKYQSDIEKMRFNPEVTVRSRGVMEKCTFCVQRIQNAKIDAKSEGRELKDGDIATACEQACPTRAIVFGDLNDEKARVRETHGDARSYAMLEELNVKPRVRYLAKLRNSSGASAGAPGHHEDHHEG